MKLLEVSLDIFLYRVNNLFTINFIKSEVLKMKREYIRTDKNGTKYYRVECPCNRCGGAGIIPAFSYVEGGICFECGGNGGWHWEEEKEYTPEYEAKLEARRKAREEKRIAKAKEGAEERNQEFFANKGFNENGKTYVVLGNTYVIKEELKAMGAKWENCIGWHLPQDTDKYPTVELDVEDIYFKDYTDSYKWNNYKRADEETYSAKIEEAKRALVKATNPTEFYGEVGEKVTKTVVFSGSHSYTTHFTYNGETHYIHTFKDNENHVFVWKTSKELELVEGSKIVLTGTVKEHNEYKGINQTVLTRCKIA